MITILGALIGFLGSALPQIIKYLTARVQYKHELEMFRLQIETIKIQGALKLQEMEARADIEESKVLHKRAQVTLTGWIWVDGILSLLNSSVRPVITYVFCVYYGFIKWAQYHVLLAGGQYGWEAVIALWTDAELALFSCIICYWFGNRSFRYALDRFSPYKEVNNGNGS